MTASYRRRTPPEGFDLRWVRDRLAEHAPRQIPLADAKSALVSGPAKPHSRAAVAAILRQAVAGPEVLLIRRAEHPGDPWSGHMAFPGGRAEPEDADLMDTAVRETREEIGWELGRFGRPLGRLDDLPAVAGGRATGLVITPFVFEVPEAPPVRANQEVSEVLWAPLAPMVRGEMATEMPYKHGELTLKLPAHDVDGRIVWGLTYRMLELLFAALAADA